MGPILPVVRRPPVHTGQSTCAESRNNSISRHIDVWWPLSRCPAVDGREALAATVARETVRPHGPASPPPGAAGDAPDDVSLLTPAVGETYDVTLRKVNGSLGLNVTVRWPLTWLILRWPLTLVIICWHLACLITFWHLILVIICWYMTWLIIRDLFNHNMLTPDLFNHMFTLDLSDRATCPCCIYALLSHDLTITLT